MRDAEGKKRHGMESIGLARINQSCTTWMDDDDVVYFNAEVENDTL